MIHRGSTLVPALQGRCPNSGPKLNIPHVQRLLARSGQHLRCKPAEPASVRLHCVSSDSSSDAAVALKTPPPQPIIDSAPPETPPAPGQLTQQQRPPTLQQQQQQQGVPPPPPPKAPLRRRGTPRDAVLGNLVQWAIKAGIRFAGVRPEARGGGVDGGSDQQRGLFTTIPVTRGETIVSVPAKSAISVSPGERTPSEAVVSQAVWASLPWFAQLALKLCIARAAGPSSPLADYLAVLPASVDLPATWDAERLAQLHYPYLEDRVREEQQVWRDLGRTLSPSLSRLGLSGEDLTWALCCVRSRSFAAPHFPTPLAAKAAAFAMLQAAAVVLVVQGGGPGWSAGGVELLAVLLPAAWLAAEASASASGDPRYAICPFIDFMNHSGSVQATCSYDLFADAFKVASCRSYAPGDQVLINYGDQSNDQLLQLYGFSEPGNPHDRYVMGDLLGRLQGAGPEHAEVASAASRVVPSILTEAVVTPDGFAAALVEALSQALAGRYATTSSNTSSSSSSSSSRTTTGSASGARVRAALAAAARGELESLPTTLAQDEGRLEALVQCARRAREPVPPPPAPPPPPTTSTDQAEQQGAPAHGPVESTTASAEVALSGGENDASSSRGGGGVRAGDAGGGGEGGGDGVAAVAGHVELPVAFDVAAGALEETVVRFRIEKKRVLRRCIDAAAV